MGDGAGQFALHVRQTASSCVMNSVISSATGVELGDPAKEQAFEEIAGIESRRLFAGALSILRDAGEAQDAVQEMLVRALRAQGSLIRADSPSRWLTRGASTAASADCRHLRSRGWPPVDLSVHRGSSRDPGSGAQAIDMDRASRQLSLKQRTVTLTYGYGYSVDECAALMSCRPGTVRSHIGRGLATFRKELSDA